MGFVTVNPDSRLFLRESPAEEERSCSAAHPARQKRGRTAYFRRPGSTILSSSPARTSPPGSMLLRIEEVVESTAWGPKLAITDSKLPVDLAFTTRTRSGVAAKRALSVSGRKLRMAATMR